MTPEEAKVRGLSLLSAVVLIALIGILGIIALGLVANSFRRYRKARRKPTRFVDAWSAAGRRAEADPTEEKDEPDQRP